MLMSDFLSLYDLNLPISRAFSKELSETALEEHNPVITFLKRSNSDQQNRISKESLEQLMT